jgi:transposase
MARTGRPKTKVELTEIESQQLLQWAARPSSPQSVALRAKIVLAAAGGADNAQIATNLGTSAVTVGKWRARFLEHRLAGLADEDRPGRPPSVTLDKVEEVITATLEQVPDEATHWSRTSMAARTGLSASTIGRIWRDFNLKPHRSETFKLSTDPEFVAKVVDVVGLYHNPPEKAVVLCVDEKTQVQAIDRSQPILPMTPGTIERRTHDYKRHGTTTLFAAFNVADGTVITQTQRRHRSSEFKKFLTHIDKNVPAELEIHLVADNYATHKTPEIKAWLAAHPRVHVHFIPTGSSWINQVERWFAYLTNQLLRRSAHRSVQDLETDLNKWIQTWNTNPRPFVWTKSAEEILDSLARYLQRISGAEH